ncbi:hypothetical protein PIB30_106254, partial [Stylosanthes scabra]|nr:hypothetical protein [Stylosanthes scabra]
SRAQIDSSAGGSLHTKTVEEAQDLIELVANNQYLYSLERGTVKKGVMEAKSIDTLVAQNKALINLLNNKLNNVSFTAANTQVGPCDCVEFKATLVKHVQQFWSNNHPSK